jgi:hypothetical protein
MRAQVHRLNRNTMTSVALPSIYENKRTAEIVAKAYRKGEKDPDIRYIVIKA